MKSTSFKETWIRHAIENIKLLYPNEKIDKLYDFFSKVYDRDIVEKQCVLYNNYEQTESKSTIPDMISWINEVKPITTESGSLFKHHDECFNPNTEIINGKLDLRKIVKNEKFKYLDMAQHETNTEERNHLLYLARKKDLKQKRVKQSANSEYGVSGLPSSWFFNMACATATTSKGQALISTAMCCFENFMSDNVKFLSMDELYLFVRHICDEEKNRSKNDDIWLNHDITNKELVDRLKDKFHPESWKPKYENRIIKLVKNLSQGNKNRIYYKCNLYKFINDSKKTQDLLYSILHANVKFLNPAKPEYEISKYVKKLNSVIIEYVDYKYPTPERVYRLKTQLRKTVIAIDTDSNFLNLNPWCEFCREFMKTFSTRKISRASTSYKIESSKFAKNLSKSRERESFDIKCCMTILNILNTAIDNTLNYFLECSNVDKNHRSKTHMKNEFLNKTMLLTPGKKHYMASQMVQEGVFFNKLEMDIKGMEFKKPSYSSKETRDFISDIVYNDILSVDGAPNMPKILKKINKFEKKIKNSILNNEFTYLKTANVKTAEAYSDPLSTGPYKAAYVWNELYPYNEISLPATVYMLKLNIKKPADIAKLQFTDEDTYNTLCRLMKEFSKGKATESGITNIAIPMDGKIPEWAKPYINLNEIISNNTKLILPILNVLDVKTEHKVSSIPYFSNIIKL